MFLISIAYCVMLSDMAGKAMVDYHLESETLHEDYPRIIVDDLHRQVDEVYPIGGYQERSVDGFRERWLLLCEENKQEIKEKIDD